MRPLEVAELDYVAGGVVPNDRVTVIGQKPASSYEEIQFWMNLVNSGSGSLGEVYIPTYGSGGGDYTPPPPPPDELTAEEAQEGVLTGLEAMVEQAKHVGLEYLKVGNATVHVDDLLKFVKSSGYVFDAASVANHFSNGEWGAGLEVVGVALISYGVGVAGTTLSGNPAVGVIAGFAAGEIVDSTDLLFKIGNVTYQGYNYTAEQYHNMINQAAQAGMGDADFWYRVMVSGYDYGMAGAAR